MMNLQIFADLLEVETQAIDNGRSVKKNPVSLSCIKCCFLLLKQFF